MIDELASTHLYHLIWYDRTIQHPIIWKWALGWRSFSHAVETLYVTYNLEWVGQGGSLTPFLLLVVKLVEWGRMGALYCCVMHGILWEPCGEHDNITVTWTPSQPSDLHISIRATVRHRKIAVTPLSATLVHAAKQDVLQSHSVWLRYVFPNWRINYMVKWS